jgi:lipopolysaccharide/colanic/teichoic acid biosynthesis glycosyltransferase
MNVPSPTSAGQIPTPEAASWRSDPAHDFPPDGYVSAHWYLNCKAVAEWAFCLVMLVLFSPVILATAALVKCTSCGPAFYSQTRLGRHGRRFMIHKLRTMTHNCENASGAQWAKPNDPRVTPIGRILRRTHLDELPQLWNVLKGEMSLVGPRPERPEFVPALEAAIPHYRDRLMVRPGVTGLAQVQLPPDTDHASVRRKLAYDLYYIRHASLWLDLRVVACTLVHVAGVPYHILCRMFAMPTKHVVEHAYEARPRRAAPPMLPELQPT